MNHSLKPFNTFSLPHSCRKIVQATSVEQLQQTWQQARDAGQPVLVLGAGSNVLFIEDFSGTVILNRLSGVQYAQTQDSWLIHAAAGENWHDLLVAALMRNIPGLENLALIPGYAGSAPIQNIGAYGVEFKQFCDYVDCLEPATGRRLRLSATECQFAYRDSIFKHAAGRHYIVVAVGLRLPKRWQPVLSYGELVHLNPDKLTPRQVFAEVCRIRRNRLPEPVQFGNAGSFFKNPVLAAEQAAELLSRYPHAPQYPQSDGTIKLAAGWLIDQCQLKGYRLGDAAVHQQQALVIVNLQAATSLQVVQLARLIRQRVGEKFKVWLEPEIRFIGADGEVNATQVMA